MKSLHRKASEISDPVFLQLANELDRIVNMPLDRNQMVINYFIQAVYPMGASGARYKIDGKSIDPAGVLDSKVGKLGHSVVHEICEHLAELSGESAELYANKKLFVCLNRLIPNHKKKRPVYQFHPRDIHYF